MQPRPQPHKRRYLRVSVIRKGGTIAETEKVR